jgi:2-polyprenyl-3-methyl-5-hydroxy-6-metoxy-1,4-benzoquinol methylase
MHDERIIPDKTPLGIYSIHLKRYEFAKTYMKGKLILDVACGVGYGTRYLSDAGNRVIGVEIDSESIRYAQKRYSSSGQPLFVQSDATILGINSDTFDVICSFETIEHMRDVDGYLKEIKRVLKPSGLFIVSTPMVSESNINPENPFHNQEWNPTDFQHLLTQYFGDVKVFSQSRRQTKVSKWVKRVDLLDLRRRFIPKVIVRKIAQVTGVRSMDRLELDDVVISRGIIKEASEIVIVATDENNK